MVKVFLSRIIRLFYREGKTYRVPWGKNKGFQFIFRNDLNTDMLLGLHEPNTFEVFDIFVRQGMIVADVGSNIGYFTRYLSKKVTNSGKVFAFEPIPATCQRLHETIHLNGLSNVEIVAAAVSNTENPVTMFLSHTHYMASLDSSWAGQQGGNISVNAVRLDSFFKKRGIKPDLIKMDIEGGEYELLASSNLGNPQAMIIEFHSINERYDEFTSMVENLKLNYFIAHIHINNFANIHFGVPDVIEVTFVRKDIVPQGINLELKESIPTTLDSPCDPRKEDVTIYF